jgi:hypothetical protein
MGEGSEMMSFDGRRDTTATEALLLPRVEEEEEETGVARTDAAERAWRLNVHSFRPPGYSPPTVQSPKNSVADCLKKVGE